MSGQQPCGSGFLNSGCASESPGGGCKTHDPEILIQQVQVGGWTSVCLKSYLMTLRVTIMENHGLRGRRRNLPSLRGYGSPWGQFVTLMAPRGLSGFRLWPSGRVNAHSVPPSQEGEVEPSFFQVKSWNLACARPRDSPDPQAPIHTGSPHPGNLCILSS